MKVVVYPAENKISKKTGMIPIYVRLRTQTSKKEIRTNIELSKNDLMFWDPMSQTLANPKNPLFQEVLQLHVRLGNSELESNFSNDEFIKTLINGTPIPKVNKANLWVELIQKYYNDKIQNSKLSHGTKKNYRVAIDKMTAFLKVNRLEDISIEKINVEFAQQFLQYMFDISETGMRENTALNHIKKFRKIVDYFIDIEKMSKNPFKRVKLDASARKRDALSIEDVSKIFCHYPKNQAQEIYLDIIRFCLLTGLAHIDVFSLTKEHLEWKGNDLILNLYRKKTGVETFQVLPEFCKNLILKYYSLPNVEITGKIFPMRSNQKFNTYLKILVSELSIEKVVSSHILRHTFRSLLEDAGINNMKVVKYLMGHTLMDDIEGVYNHSKKHYLFQDAADKLNLLVDQISKAG